MTSSPSVVYAAYLGVYLVILLSIGIYHAARIKTADEFLVAGRNVGFWGIVGTVIATLCGATTFIGFVGQGYSSGIRGVFLWIFPMVLFSVVFALGFGRILRQLRLYTIPDAFALRYGKAAAFIPSLFQIFVFGIPILALQFVGMGWIFKTFIGLTLESGILVGFAFILVYTVLGGLPTTILTDAIQTVLLASGLIILFFCSVHCTGGVASILETTPPKYWRPIGSAGSGKFLESLLTFGAFHLVFQTTWQRVFASRDDRAAVWGVSTGFILAGLLLCLSFLIGMVALAYLPQNLRPDTVFTLAVSTMLSPYVGGLVIVALSAAIMSGADSFIMMATASVARDLYQGYLNPEASSNQVLRISRLSVLFVSCVALIVAFNVDQIVPVMVLAVKATGAGLAIPFLALMFWRRSTRKGVCWGMAAGGGVTLGWHFAGSPVISGAVLGYLSCLVLTVGVSLLTDHASDEQIKAAYYEALDTPKCPDRMRFVK